MERSHTRENIASVFLRLTYPIVSRVIPFTMNDRVLLFFMDKKALLCIYDIFPFFFFEFPGVYC